MDLNGDGNDDIISGSWPGEIFFFKGGPGRTFAAPEMLKYKDGEIINIGGGVREEMNMFLGIPGETQAKTMILIAGSAKFETTDEGTFAVYQGKRYKETPEKTIGITGTASTALTADWDDDGDYDLIVGNSTGAVFLIPNEGTSKDYEFGKERQIAKVARRAGPYVADWDNDGDLDLLVGAEDGSVSLFVNTGSRESPELAKNAVVLVPSVGNISSSNAPSDVQRGIRSKICVADWNGDGLLDLLVGDLTYQKPDLPEPTPQQQAEYEKIREELKPIQERLNQISQKLFNPGTKLEQGELEKLQEEQRELSMRRSELRSKLPPEYETHGWVWLFLRR